MKWITREHAKVDRIACPWLIKNFIDKDAEFLFVTAHKVIEISKEQNAIPGNSKVPADLLYDKFLAYLVNQGQNLITKHRSKTHIFSSKNGNGLFIFILA